MRKPFILALFGLVWIFLAGGCLKDGDYFLAAVFGGISILCLFIAHTLKKRDDMRYAREQELLAKYRRKKERQKQREERRKAMQAEGSHKLKNKRKRK